MKERWQLFLFLSIYVSERKRHCQQPGRNQNKKKTRQAALITAALNALWKKGAEKSCTFSLKPKRLPLLPSARKKK